MTKPFWQTTSLLEMNHEQWESVCDGCAKCCLVQLEDEETQELVFTDVVCDLLDKNTCQCSDYQNRSTLVPECMTMNKDNVQQCAEFAPPSCAYRLLLEGKPLPDWHHLVSNSKNTVHQSNKSVKNKVISMSEVIDSELEERVVEWPLESI